MLYHVFVHMRYGGRIYDSGSWTLKMVYLRLFSLFSFSINFRLSLNLETLKNLTHWKYLVELKSGHIFKNTNFDGLL